MSLVQQKIFLPLLETNQAERWHVTTMHMTRSLGEILKVVNSLRSVAANVLFLGQTRLAVCLVLRCVHARVISQYIENRYFYLKRSFNVTFRLLCLKMFALNVGS